MFCALCCPAVVRAQDAVPGFDLSNLDAHIADIELRIANQGDTKVGQDIEPTIEAAPDAVAAVAVPTEICLISVDGEELDQTTLDLGTTSASLAELINLHGTFTKQLGLGDCEGGAMDVVTRMTENLNTIDSSALQELLVLTEGCVPPDFDPDSFASRRAQLLSRFREYLGISGMARRLSEQCAT